MVQLLLFSVSFVCMSSYLFSAELVENRQETERPIQYVSLHDAVQFGSYEDVKNYIENTKQININEKDGNGKTPLYLAVLNSKHRVKVFFYLVNRGAQLIEPQRSIASIKRDDMPLQYSLITSSINYPQGLSQLMTMIYERQIDIETTYLGYTLLHWAVIEGNQRGVALLLRLRANPDALTADGKTALYLAVVYHKYSIFSLLVKRNALFSTKFSENIPTIKNENEPHVKIEKIETQSFHLPSSDFSHSQSCIGQETKEVKCTQFSSDAYRQPASVNAEIESLRLQDLLKSLDAELFGDMNFNENFKDFEE